MRLEVNKYLFDIREACARIGEFTHQKTFAEYTGNAMLRSAVERQLEIVGEALNQLTKLDPATAARITGHRRIIAFRNILVHAYAQIDHKLVWGVVAASLPTLISDIERLFDGAHDR